ncbi:MAG TPA: alpha/beta hydrolase, partial [Nitrososphaeraceae archaeon]|nr:alpha/beta hydrolase [Nitrososphaeraceae archaeon]
MFNRYTFLNFTMNVKGSNSMLHFSLCMTTMFFAIIVLTVIISSLTSNVNHIVIAQQQENTDESNNQTLSHTKQQPPPFMEDLSFDIDGVTFSHHMASVNGIQLHYVTGGQGDPIVLLHGFPQSWYEWRHSMPALAKNYTVVVPDLRGFGDSSKPITGYDGKTTAEDIYQLVSQLDFNNQPILLVAHDVGAQTAYSYAFFHPNNVSKLVIMDFPYPGFLPPEFGEKGPWWFAFHQTLNLPEFLVEGKEREYISWFFKELAYNPSAITEEDIDIFANQFSAPGTARSAFEYFRAFSIDAEQNIESAKTPITIPVLALGGDIYPGLGGDIPGNFAASSLQSLATNVTGVTVPLSGHWIPE